MAKLVVEVLDATDLMPKDGHGSANPFVEIEFEEQRKRTSTKPKDLNPIWSESLVFNIKNIRDFASETIEVFVYNDRNKHGHHKNFLGRVRISGSSIASSDQEEASVQRYPLDKRGIFSNVKGDIALKIYAVHGNEPLEEVIGDTNNMENQHNHDTNNNRYHYRENYAKPKKKRKEKEVRSFYSVGTGPPKLSDNPIFKESGFDFSITGPAPSSTEQKQKSEYSVTETKPPLAARMGYWGRDKTASTYDLVEQTNFLYVSVIKGMDLPVMDVTGSLDPYVEVKIGNYRGVTQHLEKNQNPTWKKTFAFAKEKLQSNMVDIAVRDKDVSKDDFVGKYSFDIAEVPVRVPPDSPLAPQWYRLENKKGELLKKGEIMLAVWMGTQADEAFPDAWHSDAHNISQQSLSNTRSKVYFSPKLYYLRAHVIAAQDIVPSDPTKPPEISVGGRLGDQGRSTKPSLVKTVNPEWNEEMIFIASEPFDEFLIFTVQDGGGVIGRVIIPTREIPHRSDTSKLPNPKWYSLYKPSDAERVGERKDHVPFASRILIRLVIDGGYHVLDESNNYSSDLQPSAKNLRKQSIGILEVGILSARNMVAMKSKEGKLTDAYCVAKYGSKWVRTRTILDTLNPQWNEQYTWDVHDPCTVITIAVFDNCHVSGDAKDKPMGKVRIRLSTLETDRVYTHFYPLLVLSSSGLKKYGEIHLALRFTCTNWVKMLTQYGKPLLPKMHYVQPISIQHIEWLRLMATLTVAEKLARAEPPLRNEAVEYILEMEPQVWNWSLRRSKAHFHRIMSIFSTISYIFKWFDGICYWKNPLTTILVQVLIFILISYPELILPTFFFYLFVIGLWNYRFRPRLPPHMDALLSQAEDAKPDEMDEEFDTFPTAPSRDHDIVKMRYDRLRTVAGRVQTVMGDLATQGERTLGIVSWRDPRATAIFIVFALIWAVFLYVTPFKMVAMLFVLYHLRHPRFRSKLPSVPVNFFKRVSARTDSLL